MSSPYDATYYAARDRWRDRHIEAQTLLRMVGLRAGTRILDVGCGGGLLLSLARGGGAQALGVEVNWEALQLARRRVSGAAIVAVGLQAGLPFRSGVLDAVLSQHVLEHVDQPLDHLHEWRRVLGRKGAVALATPNSWYPDPAHFFDPDHRHIWNPVELAVALRSVGFVEVSCWTLFPYLGQTRVARALSVRLGSRLKRLTHFNARGRTLIGYASL